MHDDPNYVENLIKFGNNKGNLNKKTGRPNKGLPISSFNNQARMKKMDTSVVKIEIMENDGSTVESIELDSAKREAKNLKEQYKKFRQNK